MGVRAKGMGWIFFLAFVEYVDKEDEEECGGKNKDYAGDGVV